MGDVPGMRLAELRAEVNRRLGPVSKGMAEGVNAIVCTSLRCWPERAMTALAAKGGRDPATLDAISVIWAKVREVLEARWGMDANTQAALDRLVQPVVVELSKVWFKSPEHRIAFRGCIVEALRAKD